MRRAAKVDLAQGAIVEGLRKAGYRVEVIGHPVDLLVGRHWGNQYLWCLVEVKTPTKTGKRPSKDKRQKEQETFIQETGTPVVVNLEQALEALRGL